MDTDNYIEKLIYKAKKGEELSELQKKIVLTDLDEKVTKSLEEEIDSYKNFKKQAPLLSTFYASLKLGKNYRRDYIEILKGIKTSIKNHKCVLDGITITTSNLNNNNFFTVLDQDRLRLAYDEIYCEFLKTMSNVLENDLTFYGLQQSYSYKEEMKRTRQKILGLALSYTKK